MEDMVNHPKHYTSGAVETIDYIEGVVGTQGTYDTCIANALKYLSRSRLKGKEVEDLEKAVWYVNKAILLYYKLHPDNKKEEDNETKIVVLDKVPVKTKKKSNIEEDLEKFKGYSYQSDVPGTAKLIRSEKDNTIKIVWRKNNNKNTINCVCIPDELKIDFFNDCRNSNTFEMESGYKIAFAYDPKLYSYWSGKMNYFFVDGAKNEN